MRGRFSGFTLIELLVTVALIAILATLAVPSFRDTIRRNKVATTHNELVGALSLARTEALRSTHGGGVCGASSDGTDCNGTADWSTGWLVWSDADDTAGFDKAKDQVVRWVQGRDQMSIGVSGANDVQFNRRGMRGNGATGLLLKPSECPSGQDLVRNIAINAGGQVATTKGNCT